jgi:hypothetical protein
MRSSRNFVFLAGAQGKASFGRRSLRTSTNQSARWSIVSETFPLIRIELTCEEDLATMLSSESTRRPSSSVNPWTVWSQRW